MSRRGQLVGASVLLVVAVVVAATVNHWHRHQLPAPPPGPVATIAAGVTTSQVNAAVVTTTTVAVPPNPATTTTTARTPPCATAALSASLTNLGVAAGTEYQQLALKNVLTSPCSLKGYPGVSFVDAAGRPLGAPASPSPAPVAPVVVAPGKSGYAVIAVHDAYVATTDGCQPATAAGLRVIPPAQAAPLAVATSVMVCANPADTADAQVTPVGALPGRP